MTVVESILERVSAAARAAEVADVRIGLGYTAVRFADDSTGLAYTFRDDVPPGCTVLDGKGALAGRQASDLIRWLSSSDTIEAGVGLACANALANVPSGHHQIGDVLSRIEVRPDDAVAMVGLFRPLVAPLRERAGRLTVYERIRQPQDDLRPAEEALDDLPSCQVAVITATSILNHTIDNLLAAAHDCREVVILGSSTPLLPHVFPGATVLSGVVVREPREVLRVVSEGGGMRLFGRYVDKVCVPSEIS